MQNSMNNPKALFTLLCVPQEALDDANIKSGDIIQFTTDKGRLIIERVNPSETDFVCSGDCEHCPLFLLDCGNDCVNCPCREICDESEAF